jgi:hypothetical protein
MRYKHSAALIAFSFLAPCAGFAQLSITNYQVVSQQPITSTMAQVTFRADVVNSGPALGSVTATVSSLDPFTMRTLPGTVQLNFSPVPANSQVTSSNTFILLVTGAIPPNFNYLQWTFQTGAATGPIANAGASQTSTVGKTVTLNGSGSSTPSGTLSYSWQFTSRPPGSASALMNPLSVMPSFVVDVAGSYVVKLTVSNGAASSSASVTISTTAVPPVANAGPNQTVALGATVVLNGTGSTDAGGNPITYSWTLLTRPIGSAAALTGAATVSPTFVADKPGTYVAQLIVNDGFSSSTPITVTITTLNTPPVANAGTGQVVSVGSQVQLNGTGSTDVDGNPLTYQWSLTTVPFASLAVLSNPAAVNPTFVVDLAGTYVAQLIVNDGFVNSAPATVTITTTAVLPPTAIAGPSQTVAHHTMVFLSGSGTDPQSLLLSYQWTLISRPMGSTATLSSSTIQNPTFFADLMGTYVAQLVVNNGVVGSVPSNVTITTTNTAPVASAGANQTFTAGTAVTLNGNASSDADSDPLTYSWSLLTRPAGSAAALTQATTVSPAFTADVAGIYVAQLIVNDGIASSNPATVTITANAPAATLSFAPASLTISGTATQNLTLNLSAPAPAGGLTINLSSTNTAAATVPATVNFAANATSVSVPVTGVASGSTTIHASALPNIPDTTASVTDSNGLIMPANVVVGPGQSVAFPVTLSTGAPAGGLFVTLASSDTSKVTVTSGFIIPAGATAPVIAPKVNGINFGQATITASAQGYPQATQTVLTGFTVSFSPTTLTISGNTTQQLFLLLSGTAPAGGLTVNISSTNPGAATVPATVLIPAGTTNINVPVKGVGPGSAVIHASTPTIPDVTANVTVTGTSTLGITATSGSSQITCLNTPFGSPLVVTVNDLNNNPISGVTVTFTPPAVTGSLTFAGGVNTAVTNAFGVATSALMTANGSIGNYNVTASAPGAGTPAIFSMINAGCTPPNLAASSGTPQTSPTNAAFLAPLVVTLTKNSGVTPLSGVTVTFTAPTSGASGTFANGVNTAVTNASGVATSPVFTANGILGQYLVVATAAGSTSASFSLTNCNCAATSITATSGTPQTVATNLPFGTPLVVTVRDASNLPVSGATVTFTAPSSGASGTFAGGVNTAVTNSGGVATSAIFTANAIGGTYTVGATVQGVATPANFTLTNTALAPNAISITDGVSIGQYLQVMGTVTVGTPAPAGGLVVTLTVNNLLDPNLVNGGPRQAQVSAGPTTPGQDSTTVTIPPGATSTTYYLQGDGNASSVTYTASAPGFVNKTATIFCTPSAIVLAGPAGMGKAISVSLSAYKNGGPATPLTVSMAQVDSFGNFSAIQQMGAGNSVTISLSNTNFGAANVATPVTISGGSSGATANLTPFAVGSGVVSVIRTPNFSAANNAGSLNFTVAP